MTRPPPDEAERLAVCRRYPLGEEIFSSISHGVGALLAVAAIVLLIVRAVFHAPEGRMGVTVTSMAVYGATAVMLYLMSTLYHALTPYLAKKVFSVLDHSSIYLLIAGTYTPFCLVSLGGRLGWSLFGVIWGCAVAGITLYACWGKRFKMLNLLTYIVMGWQVVVAIKPLYARLPQASFALLVAGGLAYTLGCIFYAMKKLPWTHAIWHLFVLAGSILHFFAIYFSLPLPPAA